MVAQASTSHAFSAQAVALAGIAWCTVFQCWQTTVSGDTSRQSVCYPLEATRYLREHHFQGNLLTPFHAGSFMSWEMYPAVKVSLDGRYEVAYAPQCLMNIGTSSRPRAIGHASWIAIRMMRFSSIKTPKSGRKLEAYRDNGPWKFVYEDQAYAILMRRL